MKYKKSMYERFIGNAADKEPTSTLKSPWMLAHKDAP